MLQDPPAIWTGVGTIARQKAAHANAAPPVWAKGAMMSGNSQRSLADPGRS